MDGDGDDGADVDQVFNEEFKFVKTANLNSSLICHKNREI